MLIFHNIMFAFREIIFIICFLTLLSSSNADNDHSNLFPPKFLKPRSMNELVARPAGSSTVLKCAAEGNPAPEITWIRDGNPLTKSGNLRKNKWSLKFKHLTIADSGIYSCILSNPLGRIDFNFTLEVVERIPSRPIMSEEYPCNQTVYIGDTATFECRFVSDLHASIGWIKYYQVNDSYTDHNGNFYKKVVRSKKPNYTDPKFLVIENVTYEDAGKYACIASNIFGDSQRSVWLSVIPRVCKYTMKNLQKSHLKKIKEIALKIKLCLLNG